MKIGVDWPKAAKPPPSVNPQNWRIKETASFQSFKLKFEGISLPTMLPCRVAAKKIVTLVLWGLWLRGPTASPDTVKWSHSVVSDSATPWTAAYQAPSFMGFSRQEYWSGLPFPSPGGIFPTQRSNPGLPHCRQTIPPQPRKLASQNNQNLKWLTIMMT